MFEFKVIIYRNQLLLKVILIIRDYFYDNCNRNCNHTKGEVIATVTD